MNIPREPFWQGKLLNNSGVVLKEHPISRFLYEIREECLAIAPVQDVERLIHLCHEKRPWLSLMKGCGLCYLLLQ